MKVELHITTSAILSGQGHRLDQICRTYRCKGHVKTELLNADVKHAVQLNYTTFVLTYFCSQMDLRGKLSVFRHYSFVNLLDSTCTNNDVGRPKLT